MTKNLVTLNDGEMCKVCSIEAGKCATKRLYEMGLNTGACLKVIKNDSGPVIVSLNGNKIALGRGLACKVHVGV